MNSPFQPRKSHYTPLPRTSADSELSNLIEDIEYTSEQLDGGTSVHRGSGVLGIKGIKISFRTTPIARLLGLVSLLFSLTTLIVSGIRLGRANHEDHRWINQNRRFIGPIIAFTSFDMFVHLVAVVCFILSRHLHLTIISTDSAGPDAQQVRSSKRGNEDTSKIAIVVYLVEAFIIVTLMIGLFVDIASHRISGLLADQFIGWTTIFLRLLCLVLWPKKTESTKITVSISFSSSTSRKVSHIGNRDLEAGIQREEAQARRATQEQTTGIIYESPKEVAN